MALFENRFGSKGLRALGVFVFCAGLMGVGGEAIGGHEGGDHTVAFPLSGGAVDVSIVYGELTTEATYTLVSNGDGTIGPITSDFTLSTFIIAADITALALTSGVVFGKRGSGDAEFRIDSTGVVANVAFSSDAPASDAVHLQNIDTITLNGGMVTGTISASGSAGVTFNLVSGSVGTIESSGFDDVFIIASDLTVDSPTLAINGVLDGGVGQDEIQFNTDAVVTGVAFSSDAPASGRINVQNIEAITIDGGTINQGIDFENAAATSDAGAGITFNLMSGAINSSLTPDTDVVGSSHDDIFNIRGTIVVNGDVLGGDGDDVFNIESGRINRRVSAFGLLRNIGGRIIGDAGADTFVVTSNIVDDVDGGDAPALTIATALQGGTGNDIFRLDEGGVVNNIVPGAVNPESGDVRLDDFEVITINGGTVNMDVVGGGDTTYNIMSGTIGGNIIGGIGAENFNLLGGTITGDVIGDVSGDQSAGGFGDTFTIGAGITIGGRIDGQGAGSTGIFPALRLADGFEPTAANFFL